jgi:hypothetical protein
MEDNAALFDWNRALAEHERLVGPEDEFDPEVNGDPTSTLGDDDETGFDDDPWGDDPSFEGDDDEDEAEEE